MRIVRGDFAELFDGLGNELQGSVDFLASGSGGRG